MKITRIDKDRNLNEEVGILEISHNGELYTITPEHSGLRIHKHSFDDPLAVYPGYSNEIVVK